MVLNGKLLKNFIMASKSPNTSREVGTWFLCLMPLICDLKAGWNILVPFNHQVCKEVEDHQLVYFTQR